MRVLGIETSCDETGVAIYDAHQGLVAHALYSQVGLHRQYGGVVPELASRDHLKRIVFLVESALEESGLGKEDITAVAYTAGPGLIGALLSGACFAKSFAYARGIPALAIHHLEAHILAAQLDNPALTFPFLVLLVSGGHTQLIEAHALGKYQILGDTLDDAVGEAFDKAAKLMGIEYPGGPKLAQLADVCDVQQSHHYAQFPRPMLNRPGLDFSFSGLKTHALNVWSDSDKSDTAKSCIAYLFQDAVVDTLVKKCKRALLQTGHTHLVVAGGVGANQTLRARLSDLMMKMHGQISYPKLEFCTDNGAMVAYTGFLHLKQQSYDKDWRIDVKSRWPL